MGDGIVKDFDGDDQRAAFAGAKSEAAGVRNVIYGTLTALTVALILNLGVGIWYFSGLEHRVRDVETQVVQQRSDIGRLDSFREAAQLRMAHTDDLLKDIGDKVGAILDVVTGADPGGNSGVETRPAQPNFQRSPKGRQ